MDLIQHIERMKKFSEQTFGPGARHAGVCEHIRSELKEIEAEPHALTEWCDVILLALDGAWRQGFSAQEIAQGIEAKQSRNEKRTWPDYRNYREGEAIEHIGETPEGCHAKGTIVRYDNGPTALVRIDSVFMDHGGRGNHRYYGAHCMGGAHGVYHREVSVADDSDIEIFRNALHKLTK